MQWILIRSAWNNTAGKLSWIENNLLTFLLTKVLHSLFSLHETKLRDEIMWHLTSGPRGQLAIKLCERCWPAIKLLQREQRFFCSPFFPGSHIWTLSWKTVLCSGTHQQNNWAWLDTVSRQLIWLSFDLAKESNKLAFLDLWVKLQIFLHCQFRARIN